jgi:hypothetical protein
VPIRHIGRHAHIDLRKEIAAGWIQGVVEIEDPRVHMTKIGRGFGKARVHGPTMSEAEHLRKYR